MPVRPSIFPVLNWDRSVVIKSPAKVVLCAEMESVWPVKRMVIVVEVECATKGFVSRLNVLQRNLVQTVDCVKMPNVSTARGIQSAHRGKCVKRGVVWMQSVVTERSA